jgi:hypothetical protein
MNVSVLRINGSVVFDLSKPTGFVALLVSSSDEEIQWELEPLAMQPVTIVDGEMFGVRSQDNIGQKILVRVPRSAEAAVREAMSEVIRDEEPDYPAVSRIVYGEVPAGYREVRHAAPLKDGETYCLLVLGRSFDRGAEFFTG